MKKIFVAIGAYNEPDIIQTVNNCLENAEYPERISFGISAMNNDGNAPVFSDDVKVKLLKSDYPTTFGTSVNRMLASLLNDSEDYYLQIDGHMLFQKNWDSAVIQNYETIKAENGKCIITTYTPWWSYDEDGSIKYYSPESDARSHNLIVMPEWDIQAKDSFLRITGGYVDWDSTDKNYSEHYLLSAHFLFSEMSFVEDIMPDPLLTLPGEEPVAAMRAWTHGYRIFTIKDPIAWHKNKWDGKRYEFDRLFDKRDSHELNEHWHRRQTKAILRTMEISLGKILGFWGSPSLEKLREYEEASGINYVEFYKKIREMAEAEPETYSQTKKMMESFDNKYGEYHV